MIAKVRDRLRQVGSAADGAVSSAVLWREASRTSRRWQTYAARAGFSGVLFTTLLLGIWVAVGATDANLIDPANLGWLGRGMFIGFAIVQILLALLLAPLMTATAIVEESDDRTMELLVLTRLAPHQIFAAKVLSRVLLLMTIVAGALPVMAMVVTLGGVSPVEVVSVTVHTLTTVVLVGTLGAFFALFTRSPMLCVLAAASYSVPFFVLMPTAYAMVVLHPQHAVHFSPFMGPLAEDWTSLLPVLSYLPAMVVVFRLGSPLFALKVSNADIRHAFSGELWNLKRWAQHVAGLLVTAIVVLPAAGLVCWTMEINQQPLINAAVDGVLYVIAIGCVWVWFTWATAVGTWAFLRVGMDVVDGLDGVFGGRTPADARRRKAVAVWSNPVSWREARPRAWGATALPVLGTWLLVLLGIAQTGWWIFPGGVLAIGVLNTAAALLLTVWLATRSIEDERRTGTLEVLLTTTLPSSRILWGKVLGIALPTLPLVLLSAPLLVLGLPHLHMIEWLDDKQTDMLGWAGHGLLAWVWVVPIWIAALLGSMLVAMRVKRSRSAFAVSVGGLLAVLGLPTLVGRLFPDFWPLAVPARLLAPALAGSAAWWLHVASIASLTVVATALALSLAARLRPWASTALALALCIGVAMPDVASAQNPLQTLAMRVEPLGDGLVRPGSWAGLRVQVANAGRGTTGTLVLEERGSGTEMIRWERTIDLPEQARREVVLHYRPSGHTRERVVELRTADGRALAESFSLRAVQQRDVAIGVLGFDPVGLTALSTATRHEIPGRVPRVPDGSEPRSVRTGLIPLAAMPRHSALYEPFDFLVWPQGTPAGVTARQADAVRSWVADGGHLVLTVTDQWRQWGDSALAPALPVVLDGQRDLMDGSDLLHALGGARAEAVLPVATGRVRTDRRTWTLAGTRDAPLWVVGRYGLGTVHVLLADPSTAPLATEVRRDRLWESLLWLPAANRGSAGVDDITTYGTSSDRSARVPAADADLAIALHAWDPTSVQCFLGGSFSDYETWEFDDPEAAWSGRVRDHLNDIPGVAPLPISWLVAFSGLYLLVIGPLDFAVLRWMRRQPWTWVTFPVTIAVFSGAALVGTSLTKGSTAVLTRVEVVDALPDGIWRGQSWLAVFSTRKTRLTLASSFPDSAIAPMDEAGMMGGPSVRSSEGPGVLAWDAETWTLAYAATRWTAEGMGTVRARMDAEGMLLTSDLPFELRDAVVIYDIEAELGRNLHRVGTVVPGEQVHVPSLGGSGTLTLDDADAVASMLVDLPERGRGHLHAGVEGPVLMGLAPEPVERLSLTGLAPEERTLTWVRIPLTLEHE